MKIRKVLSCLLMMLLLGSLNAQEVEVKTDEAPQSDATQLEEESEEAPSLDGHQLIPSAKNGFGLSTLIADPSSLRGSDRRETVLNRNTRTNPNNFTGYFVHNFTERQQFLAEVNLSPIFLGADLSYAYQPDGWDGAFRTNLSYSTSEFAPFYAGNPDVTLPNGDDPYLQSFSTGIEYAHRFNDDFTVALGTNYRKFGFADQLLGGNRFPADVSGRPLAFGAGSGSIYSLDLHGLYTNLDDPGRPISGTQIRFGASQGVDLGGASSSFTRLTANVAQYIPAPGFNDGDHSVVLSVQGGTVLGTPPQVAGFHLGGASSVRGFQQSGMASGTSFVQATAEYRHFIKHLKVFGFEGDLRGVGFLDYGSVLGTQNELAGIPPGLSDRPADSFGYGLGLQFATKDRLYRIESGWTGFGDQNLIFVVGEKF